MGELRNRRVIVLFSGGMDSTVLLKRAKQEARAVASISFDYGQRHKKELEYASRYAEKLGIQHITADISSINGLLAGSALTSPEITVPEGHYEDESMKAMIVPNRNMIMLSIAIGWAVSLEYDAVAMAGHAGDRAIYLDCRPEFVKAMGKACQTANEKPIAVLAPFLSLKKGEIVQLGLQLGVDFAETWSCYRGDDEPCGTCGACVERKEALNE